jgi:hypothetical protein
VTGLVSPRGSACSSCLFLNHCNCCLQLAESSVPDCLAPAKEASTYVERPYHHRPQNCTSAYHSSQTIAMAVEHHDLHTLRSLDREHVSALIDPYWDLSLRELVCTGRCPIPLCAGFHRVWAVNLRHSKSFVVTTALPSPCRAEPPTTWE